MIMILANTAFGFILGTVLGSLVKVLADRSLENSSFFGRSRCNFCQHRLGWVDLIPLLSFILLKGKCRYCHKKLTGEYFLVEAVMGVLIAALFYLNPFNPAILFVSNLIFKAFILVVLVVVFLTDLKKTIIPDRITYPAIIISLIFITVLTIIKIILIYLSLNSSTLGKYLLPPHSDYFLRHVLITAQGLLGSLVMGLLIGLFFLILIVLTKGRGMGGGDLKLGVFLGLALGFPQALLALMMSFLLGSVTGIMLLVLKKKHFGQTIPFGPFLSLGGLVSLYWGEQLLDWYLKLKPGY